MSSESFANNGVPWLRREFTVGDDHVFLNHAGYGRLPQSTQRHQQRNFEYVEQNPSRFFESAQPGNRIDLNGRARRAIADLIGADSSRLALVTNATFALNMVAQTLSARQATVVGTSLDYGGVQAMWRWHAQHKGLTYVPVPVDAKHPSLEPLVWALDILPSNVFAVVPHIASTTCTWLDVNALAQRTAAPVIVDGAQAVGQINLDLESSGVDIYIGVCHKWLCAPRGTAFVWVSERFADFLEPLTAAVTTTDFDVPFGERTSWLGTTDPTGWISIEHCIDFFQHKLVPAAEDASQRLKTVCGLLRDIGWTALPHHPNGLAASLVAPKGTDPLRLRIQFELNDIELPVLEYQGAAMVRVSCAWYVSDADLQRLVDVLSGLT